MEKDICVITEEKERLEKIIETNSQLIDEHSITAFESATKIDALTVEIKTLSGKNKNYAIDG